MARPKRQPTPVDMVRSMAVILLPLLVVTFLFTRNLDDTPVKVVDWRPVLATARAEAPYPVLAPVNLPSGWRPTQVAWVEAGQPYLNGAPSARNLWKLGFLDLDDTFIALTQGDGEPDELVRDQTRKGEADGQSTVGAQTWERLISSDERTRSLVSRSPEVTTVISGDVPYGALESYASTLSTTG